MNDESSGLSLVEFTAVVNIELVPDLVNVGLDFLLWDFDIVDGIDGTALSMLLDTSWVEAHTKTLLLSSVEDQLIGQIVNNLEGLSLQSLNVEVLDALMIVELSSWILLVADLAHDQDLWAISLDMVVKLGSRHVLELRSVTDITAELWAVELSVGLELSESLPDDGLLSTLPASMWELTEINAVLENLVYFLEEVTTSLAIGTADVEAWGLAIRSHLTSRVWVGGVTSSISTGRHQLVINLSSHVVPGSWVSIIHVVGTASSLELQLAILAEKLVAVFALERLEWELEAHDALDLFDHLSLKLILDLVHLNVKRRNWFWAHHLLDCLIANDKVHSCIDGEALLFGVDFLEDRLISPLLLVHLIDRHVLSRKS